MYLPTNAIPTVSCGSWTGQQVVPGGPVDVAERQVEPAHHVGVEVPPGAAGDVVDRRRVGVEITPSTSTSHISAIFSLRARDRAVAAQDQRVGVMPMLRSAATECWVGLVFSSPDGAR